MSDPLISIFRVNNELFLWKTLLNVLITPSRQLITGIQNKFYLKKHIIPYTKRKGYYKFYLKKHIIPYTKRKGYYWRSYSAHENY